jgi:NhaA family Na+:H+ antiporter
MNSPLRDFYEKLIYYPIIIKTPFGDFDKPLIFWINDGLICFFFFLLGLEIKREIIAGELSDKAKLALPLSAAIGGAIVPAIIYGLFNYDNPVNMRGWAIPMATDSALSLGILALVIGGIPRSLKVFLVSLAIIDDILAVTTIAIFYAKELSPISILIAVVLMGLLVILNQARISKKSPYLILGFLLWLSVLSSGVHTSVVGVLLAIAIPYNKSSHKHSMLEQIEKFLHPWVSLAIIPIFAFINAGVPLEEFTVEKFVNPLALGIILGLFIGKQIGIFGIAVILIKFSKTELPTGTTWLQMYGVSVLCGIGFTMSLFIGSLSFASGGPEYDDAITAAIFVGSMLSAFCGYAILCLNNFIVYFRDRS